MRTRPWFVGGCDGWNDEEKRGGLCGESERLETRGMRGRLRILSAGTLASLLVFCGLCSLTAGCSAQAEAAGKSGARTAAVEVASAGKTAAGKTAADSETAVPEPSCTDATIDLSEIPAFSGDPFVPLDNNAPAFSDTDLVADSFETYSELDSLGRCGVAYASVGADLMPTEERDSIAEVKPTGWHSVKYDFVDGEYLYNRCHLIGYQLTAENATEENLITGTRYLNVEGMLPFENMVADYIKETGNHVLYRVTPVFEGDNLIASGVHMEAESVEDGGDGVSFNVYCYNVQPGVDIDYASGDSAADGTVLSEPQPKSGASESLAAGGIGAAAAAATEVEEAKSAQPVQEGTEYILNVNTRKFHIPSCPSVKRMSEKNKKEFTGTRDQVIAMGYDPCKNCNP